MNKEQADQIDRALYKAYARGFRAASIWADRIDQLADLDSPTYQQERDQEIAAIRAHLEDKT